jgi:hypothetical protein
MQGIEVKMETTDYQNKLMQHCCGLSNNENRNFFGTSKGYKDSNEFEKLVDMGLAKSHKPPSWSGDTAQYSLTDEGKKVASETMPKPKKLTRGQKNYQDYLRSDCCETFAEWMGFKTA